MDGTQPNFDPVLSGAGAFPRVGIPAAMDCQFIKPAKKDFRARFIDPGMYVISKVVNKLGLCASNASQVAVGPGSFGRQVDKSTELSLVSDDTRSSARADSPPIRVGFLRSKFNCEDGIAAHCETLMRQLNHLGVEVVVFVGEINVEPDTQARLDALQLLAFKWVQLPVPQSRLNPGFSVARQLSREIKDLNISVLHMHGMGPLILARLASWRTGVPIVATVHLTSETPSKRARAMLGKIGKPFLSQLLPNRLIAISSEIREFFRQHYAMAHNRIDTVFNGVDVSHFRPPTPQERAEARRTLGLSETDFVLSHVGRLVRVKGHDVLFDAVAQLVDTRPEIRVLCRGTGPELPALEAMCADLEITEKVSFLGHGDTRLVYWASDLFVLPSRREGFPLVVIEAMLCGAVPIRTPAAGATDQIENGVNGFICPFDDPAALARVIDLLIQDRSKLMTIRDNAVRSARTRFSASLMATKTLETYRKVIDESVR